MGSYGIGPARIVAAAIEQGADEHGIVWPRSLAPVAGPHRRARQGRRRAREAAERLYDELREAGLESLFDDRDAGPGREADRRRAARLPAAARGRQPRRSPTARSRPRSGARARTTGSRSPRRRAGGRAARDPRVSAAERAASAAACGACSGSTAPARRRRRRARGQPLRPLTIPNLVGYLRLAAIPVFLVLAFDSGDGRATAAALLYLVDHRRRLPRRLPRPGHRPVLPHGRAARPGRRPAAVLAGAVVCWHFELLPRWALAVLAVREVVTLVLARSALRRGHRPRDQLGRRIGVFLVFGGDLLGMVVDWLGHPGRASSSGVAFARRWRRDLRPRRGAAHAAAAASAPVVQPSSSS